MRAVLLAQLVRIVEQFIRSDKVAISPPLFYQDELRRRLIITLNMSRVVQHVWEAVRQENTEKLTPVFDRDYPIRSTGLGFEVLYVYRGVVRKYRPDFLIRLVNGEMLVLETKGQDTEQDQVKRRYLDE